MARLVRWESRAFLVFLDPSGPWESRVLSAPRDSQVRLVFVESKEKPALQACVVLLEPLAQLAQSVSVARLALLGSKARWDRLV